MKKLVGFGPAKARSPRLRPLRLALAALALALSFAAADPNAPAPGPQAAPAEPKAVIITVSEMVDLGLYNSIRRRTEAALQEGATHIIYELDTYGGRVDSGLDIYKYLLNDVRHRAHTVAYIPTDAISAGALITVTCEDIIMREGAKLGDSAPIVMGGQLEGVEREKIETTLRSYFTDAAQINNYPPALCRAMVSAHLEIYAVQNLETGEYHYFESDNLPTDAESWNLDDARIVVPEGELLTVTAQQAFEYGLARTVTSGPAQQALDQAIAWLESTYNVNFPRPIPRFEPNWSEQLVRWISSPAISSILLLVGLLGIYMELSSPGLGLPGLVALIALGILFGSRFLIGLANWWEIALFVIGIGLLAVEIFIIPGFGVAGIAGIIAMLIALAAMMVANRPDEPPLPSAPYEWENLEDYVLWTSAALVAFAIIAAVLARYLPHLPLARRLVLASPGREPLQPASPAPAPAAGRDALVTPGDRGVTLTTLRPSGIARFGHQRLSVVTRGQVIEPQREIVVVRLEGNSIVVKETSPDS